jgi:hypothetical protein
VDAILEEIHTYCGTECCSSQCCPEEECVLYRIERKVIEGGLGESQRVDKDNDY